VVLAEDHTLMRRSLRLLLDGQDDVDVVAEAADLAAVTRNVLRHQPEVLVLDLGMPKGSSIEVIRRLREQVPRTEIVVLTMEDSPGIAQRALDAGAIGFLLKDSADTELPEAVRRATRGEEYLSPRVAARLEAMRPQDASFWPREPSARSEPLRSGSWPRSTVPARPDSISSLPPAR
jgi:two-component system response regulator NreC